MIRTNMIRNLFATTALATFVATGALAQTTSPAPISPAEPAVPVEQVKRADAHLTSNVVGMTVYNSAGEQAEDIGKVVDLVMSPEGQIDAVVIGVGGFLGIGRKEVAIEFGLVEWAELDGNEYLIVETTKEALEAQQAFDRAAYEPMPADMDIAETKPATAEDLANAPVEEEEAAADDTAAAPAAPADDATAEAPAAEDQAAPQATAEAPATTGETAAEAPAEDATTDTAEAPAAGATTTTTDTAAAPADDAATDPTQTGAIDRSTLQESDVSAISAEDFVGTTVFGADEENIGEIGDVVLTQDGQVDAVLIDVGGFLGMGEKQIAVGMDNLQFMEDGDGNRYLYTEFTKEQLEAQPAYDEAAYAENRDTMRMSVQ